MRLRIVEIIEYYDVPQLFVAKDVVDTLFLCLTYDVSEAGVLNCIAVNISKERLNDFYTGHLDLRQVFIAPELFSYDVVVRDNVIEASLRDNVFEESVLPSEGFFLDFSRREDCEIVHSSIDEGRTIIRLAFNYDTNNHAVPSQVLTGTVDQFQKIVTKISQKLFKNQGENNANLLARAAVPASFDLELMSEEQCGLFGWTKASESLEVIAPLFSEDDEIVAECLSSYKEVVPNYKKMIKTLSDVGASFKFKWVKNSNESSVCECPVSRERMKSLYDFAASLEELEELEEVYEGRFFMANSKNGSWGFKPTAGRQKKGICSNRVSLKGITLNEQVYRVKCTVRPSRNPNTGKEYRAYIITKIDKIE